MPWNLPLLEVDELSKAKNTVIQIRKKHKEQAEAADR